MSNQVIIKRKGVVYQSRMTQILNVDLRSFFKDVKHVFVVGGSGSGKTSTLLLLTKWFYDNGETILWRDDSSLEFLSLKDVMPWLVHLPEGCDIQYEDKNIEYVHYDPWKLNTLFNQVDRDRANAVVFDLFTPDMNIFLAFWSRFFYTLYRFQRTRVKERLALITDEINDLCPSTRRGYIPRQLALSSNIYFSMKKYRKEGIRLVASTHAYGDVHKPVREAFNFYFFKKMDSQSVPERFMRYDKVIERLQVNETIVVDEERNFNKINVEEVVKPKKFAVTWSGDIRPQSEAKHTELDMWQKRCVLAAELLNKGFGVTYEQLSLLLDYKTRAGIHQFIKKNITPEDEVKLTGIMSQLEGKPADVTSGQELQS